MTTLYIAKRTDAPGLVKVGRSNNPAARLLQLPTGHCFKMVLVATFPGLGHMETTIQRGLRPTRVDTGYGREWFQSTAANVLHEIIMSLEANQDRAESETSTTSSVGDSWLDEQLHEFISNHLVPCGTMDEAPNYGRLLRDFSAFVGDGYTKDVLRATMLEYGFVPARYHAQNAFGHSTTRRVFCLYTDGFDGPVRST